MRIAAAAIAIAFITSCASTAAPVGTGQSSAEGVLQGLYGRLEAQDADGVVTLYRAKDGGALSAQQEAAMRAGLKRVFAAGPIHVDAVRVTSSRALEPKAMKLLPAAARGLRIDFAVDGTGNACLRLPINNGTGPFAELQGRWYALEDVTFGLPLTIVAC